VIEAERSRRLAEIEARGTYALDGHLSMASWVIDRFCTSRGAAASQVRTARALREMPSTFQALAAGEVSASAVAVLVAARESSPEAFEVFEDVLVEAARTLSVSQLRTAVSYWRERVDVAAAAEDDALRFERRALHLSPLLDGMVRLDGMLDPETGQLVMTALSAVCDAEVRSDDGSDHRTPAQRRADALGEVCRQWLDSPVRPSVGSERPHVVVTMDLASLEGRAGRRCELSDAGVVTGEAARRLACDAQVTRVIVDAASQPLDVGRRTKVVSPRLRRAVIVRDGGCRFPGCDRPPGWCDAHHVTHWADGGTTSLENLMLLCRRHHRLIHQRGFGVTVVDGRPAFSRPDGAMLPDRGPPLTMVAVAV
jgi:hypothetical protein